MGRPQAHCLVNLRGRKLLGQAHERLLEKVKDKLMAIEKYQSLQPMPKN